jgi:glycosyltransferase involved in cell wall biosynthesis
MTTSRLLIISHDVVDRAMAGPGIRYRELARVLARRCQVTLAVPWGTSLAATDFALATYQPGEWASLEPLARQADVIMPCGFTTQAFPQLAELGCALVLDLYDPYPAERLILASGRPPGEQQALHARLLDEMQGQCLAGDFFLASSERQRVWWLGVLAAYGRVNTATCGDDPTLRRLIDVVPFGCHPEPPRVTGPAVKGVLPGIGVGDRVLLWGGGLWDWLDPLTLLRALKTVVAHRPNVRALFPGTRHPNPLVASMGMHQRALALAGELELLGRYAFFGDWVPQADWPNYLAEADVGVSLHFDSLETHLAFRTRVLDYIGAGLPMLVTAGESAGDMAVTLGLGVAVPPVDDQAVAKAILRLLDEPAGSRAAAFARARAELSWERVAAPLLNFCEVPRRAADRESSRPAFCSQMESDLAGRIMDLEQQQRLQETEIGYLRHLVQGYEQGKFMRLMRALKAGRRRVRL